MLKLSLKCSDCGYEDNNVSPFDLNGFCPHCENGHGNVTYSYKGNGENFIIELSEMSEAEISKCAMAIKICADNLVYTA